MRLGSQFRLTLIAATTMVASLVALNGPVDGQDITEQITELESFRDRITSQIAANDAEICSLERDLAGLDAAIVKQRGAIGLVADDIERAVDARREPARTRTEMAILGYIGGDARSEAFLQEIMVLEGNDRLSRRRELYRAVIDHAEEQLNAIDERLRGLALALDEARETLAQTRQEREATQHVLDQTITERDALVVELDDAARQISELVARRQRLRRAPLTGILLEGELVRPALVVKIDNVAPARPQSGINAADVVFVELVESGLSRFAAVFHSDAPREVGPVRSMRTGDFGLLTQLNRPLFANSGGNRISRSELAESELVDVGAASRSDLYYRRSHRSAPHNLYTNPWNLWSAGSGSGGRPNPMFEFREPGEAILAEAETVRRFRIDYGATRVDYEWNGSGWARSQDGRPTLDETGVRVAPTTVIVRFTNYGQSRADTKSPEAISVGEGTAWIFTSGVRVSGQWLRPAVRDTTSYVDSNGNVVKILPGRTWIEMPKPESASILE